MDNLPKHYPTIIQSIGLSLRLILYSLIFGFAVVLVTSLINSHARPGHSFVSLVGYLFPILLTIWAGFYKYRKKEGNSLQLKFNSVPVNVVIVSIVMVLTISFIVDPFSLLFPPTGFWKRMFEDMTDTSIFTIIMAVIAAPVLEEVFFRGIILNGLLKNYSPRTAILVSAALFGLIHLNMWQAIPAFFAGILIGYLYWKTNSIIPGMVLHFINNLFCVLLALKFTEMNWLIKSVGLKTYIVILFLALITFVGGTIYLNSFFKTRPPLNKGEPEPVNVIADEDEYQTGIGVINQ